jgi:tetratricopeptide (TPR) repeat protein
VGGSPNYDVFISYARADNEGGWVSELRDAIYADFRTFSSEPFKIFFDTEEIRSRQDWESRLREGLRSSRVLLMCLSPNYLKSIYCRWEWEEFARRQARRIGGGDSVTGVYFVGLGGDEQYDKDIAAWRHEYAVERTQLEDLQPWFPRGVQALQEAEVRARLTRLGQGVHEALSQARRAKQAPGNLRRHNPWFVGRVKEIRALRNQLVGGSVGVVTAVHGVGGMGKTELAVTYAHYFAADYQGGTWQVDADGHTDLLEAVSTLTRFPELGMSDGEDNKDQQLLGRRVLGRLGELHSTAENTDPDTAACLLLLDNVSETELLSTRQLAVLPQEPWLHLLVTTRLGENDVGAAGSKASVATIPIGPLHAEDALELVREHQPARDSSRLRPDFSSPAEEEAARQIVALLDGYTLAVEQAAVYLGVTEAEPSSLLADLQAQGSVVLDRAMTEQSSSAGGDAAAIREQIQHQERLTGSIVDQTVQQLPARARAALAFASILPPDGIPWEWLRLLTEKETATESLGLSGIDDWAAAQRILKGRRLLTDADDPRLARLHRVLGAHLRVRIVEPQAESGLDSLLCDVSAELGHAASPDPGLLAVTATAIALRLTDDRRWLPGPDTLPRYRWFARWFRLYVKSLLAEAAVDFVPVVQRHLDLATTHTLAAAALSACDRLIDGMAYIPTWQRYRSLSIWHMGRVLQARGDVRGARAHYTASSKTIKKSAKWGRRDVESQRDYMNYLNQEGILRDNAGALNAALQCHTQALQIAQKLVTAKPDDTERAHDLASTFERVGSVMARCGDTEGAMECCTHALEIAEELTTVDPHNTDWQSTLSASLDGIGGLLASGGDIDGALDRCTRALQIAEHLTAVDPRNTDWQSAVSQRQCSLGGVLAQRGDHAGAIAAYLRSEQIIEELSRTDPDNTDWRRQLVGVLLRAGAKLGHFGNTRIALEKLNRAVRVTEELADADVSNNDLWDILCKALEQVGEVMVRRGETESALMRYTRALGLLEQTARFQPDNAESQNAFADIRIQVARLQQDRDSPRPEKATLPWTSWEPCDDWRGADVLERLAGVLPQFFGASTLMSSRRTPLAFYRDHDLIELEFVREHGIERAFVLDGSLGTVWLDGASDAIHTVNGWESLVLTESTVAAYLRFFLYFLRSDCGGFVLIESSDEVMTADGTVENVEASSEVLTLKTARAQAHPPLMRGLDATGSWMFDATTAYDWSLWAATYTIASDGEIDMKDDEPIGCLDGLVVPRLPDLSLEFRMEEVT